MGYQQQLAERADLTTTLDDSAVRAACRRAAQRTSNLVAKVQVLDDGADGLTLEVRGGPAALILSGLNGLGRQMLIDVSIAPYQEGSQLIVAIADAQIAQFKVMMFVPVTPKRVTSIAVYRRFVAALRAELQTSTSPSGSPAAAPAHTAPPPPPSPRVRSPAAPPPATPDRRPRPVAAPPPAPPPPSPASTGLPAPRAASPPVDLTKRLGPPSPPADPSPAPVGDRRRLALVALAVVAVLGAGVAFATTRSDEAPSMAGAPADLPDDGPTPSDAPAATPPAAPPPPVDVAQRKPGPSQILRRHLQRLNAHDYDGAFELMSPGYQSAVPNWVQARSAAEPLINVGDVGPSRVSDTTARVQITFYARDTVETTRSDLICRRFVGTAHMVKVASDWRYDPLENQLEATAMPEGYSDCP